MKDLGLDSLDQVEIIMAMEDEFGECFIRMFVLEVSESQTATKKANTQI